MSITFEPIGRVQSDFKDPKDLHFACEKGLFTKTISKIIVEENLKSGIKGLNEFSHAFVLFHLHKADKIELVTHPGPPSIKDLKRVGVFASRSQYRPNSIALRLVKIIEAKENEIVVEGLDAINGSKVLDIKPYVPGYDRPISFKTAEWYDWLEG